MLNSIDPKSAVQIYLQVIQQVKRQIASGVLAPGDQLWSVRELASQLLINPNTAARAYPERERLVRGRLREVFAEARGLGLTDDAILSLCQKTLAARK